MFAKAFVIYELPMRVLFNKMYTIIIIVMNIDMVYDVYKLNYIIGGVFVYSYNWNSE